MSLSTSSGGRNGASTGAGYAFQPGASASTATGSRGGSGSGSNPLYAAAARVPLIKSTSVSVPPPIRLPTDLHPLPPDLSAYFVYPFSLESYVLDPNTPSSSTIEALQQRYADYLRSRDEEKKREKQEVLKRLAPGWAEGGGGVMVPDSAAGRSKASTVEGQVGADAGPGQEAQQVPPQRAPIDDLVDHLAKLEAMGSKPVGDSTGRS